MKGQKSNCDSHPDKMKNPQQARGKSKARQPAGVSPVNVRSSPHVKQSSPVPIPVKMSSGASPRTTGGSPFAAAKFSDPPSPKSLPKPPTHWVSANDSSSESSWEESEFSSAAEPSLHDHIAAQLKTMLNVRA
jgi:hypothetical protein